MTTSLTSTSSTSLVRAEQQLLDPKPLTVGDSYLHCLYDQRKISLSTRYWVDFDQLLLRKFDAIDASVWTKHVDLAKHKLDVIGPRISIEELFSIAVDLAQHVEDGKGVTILTSPITR